MVNRQQVINVSVRYSSKNLAKVAASARNLGNRLANDLKKGEVQSKKNEFALKKLAGSARKAATEINKALGGRIFNAAGDLNNFGQNITSIGNRLGFLAFQWNFMANAAQRAVDITLGGLARIVQEGAQTGDALGRALSFAADARGLGLQTDEAAAKISKLRESILNLGSGQTIFGVEAISNIAKEFQKAIPGDKDISNVLKFATQLKTIDPSISDEKLATGLTSLFATLGTNVEDVNELGKAMDFVANVSDKSTANFQSAIASLGVSAQQAKLIGFTARETGAIITTVSDVLARNVGGGRASATAGQYANAFFRDLKAIASTETKQGSFARQLGLNIFDEKDGKIEFKRLVDIVGQFDKVLAGKSSGERAAILKDLGLGENSERTINALRKIGTDELQKQIDALGERGTLATKSATAEATAQSQILRIQNAINSLKFTLAEGLAPALKEIADALAGIAGDSQFRDLMGEIGNIIGEVVVPHIKTAIKFFKGFLKFLKNNRKTLRFVIIAVLGLVAALGGLFILSTIGFFALTAAGSLAAFSGQAFLAGGAIKGLRAGLVSLFRLMVPLALAGIGIGIVAFALSGVFDESLTPAILAIGAAMTALGLAVSFPNKAFALMGTAANGLINILTRQNKVMQTTLTGTQQWLEARKQFDILGKSGSGLVSGTRAPAGIGAAGFGGEQQLGKNYAQKFLTGFREVMLKQGPDKQITRSLSAVGKAGIIGAAVAIGAGLMIAFIKGMEEKVEQSAIFKTGLVNKWQQVGFRMTAATNVFVRNMFKAILGFVESFKKAWDSTGEFFTRIIGAMQVAWATFWENPFAGFGPAIEAFQREVEGLFGDFDLTKTLGAIFDPTGATGAIQEIKNSLTALEAGGFKKFDAVVQATIADILSAFDVEQGAISAAELNQIVNDIFGDNMSDFTPSQAQLDFEAEHGNAFGLDTQIIGEAEMAIIDKTATELEQIPVLKEATKIQTKVNKEMGPYIDSIKDGVAELDTTNLNQKLQRKALGQSEKSISSNTVSTDVNTAATDVETDTQEKKVDLQKLQILEIAKNINSIGFMTVRVEQVNLAMIKFATELTEAARRVSTLKVNKKTGKFSISGRQTSTSFADIPGLSRQVFEQFQNLGSAERSRQEAAINIEALSEALDELKVVTNTTNTLLEEANESVNGPQHSGDFRTLQEFKNASGSAALLSDGQGLSVLDINIDGSLDIIVQQGGLTQDDLDKLGKELDEALVRSIANQLGVQS